MLVRGSLVVKKRLQLLNPGGLVPAEGLIALSDAEGNLKWDNLKVPALDLGSTYAKPGTLVLYLNKVYFSLVADAEGEHFSDPSTWKDLTSNSSLEAVLSQDQIDALNLANSPSAGNAYATMKDVKNLSLKGTASSADILTKSPTIANILWISSTDGVDSTNSAILAGDGMVSDGTLWLGIGPVRGAPGLTGPTGPESFEDAPSDGNQYVRKDAAWAVMTPSETLQAVLDAGNSASFDGGTSTIDMFIPTMGGRVISFYTQNGDVDSGFTLQGGSTQLIGNSSISQASVGVRNGELNISTFNLAANVDTKITGTLPLVNSILKFPAKTVEGTYTLATIDDIPTTTSQLTNNSGFITSAQIPTGIVYVTGNQTVAGTKTFSSDVFVGDVATQVFIQIASNTIDVHTGDDNTFGFSRLNPYGLTRFIGALYTSVDFIAPAANTTLKFPAKATGTYTIATLDDITTSTPSPFDKANDSYFPKGRDEAQFGPIGSFSYDFSDAYLGAYADAFGQVGQIGVHPTEQYGALGDSTYAFGYNVSAVGYGDTVFGMYNHSDTASQFSLVTGRNNYNNSYSTFMSGSYNTVPYTYLGHKTVFGNGNVVNGSVGLTSGVALLNRSFGTTVIGQANLDYANTEQGVNIEAAPIFIVGNGSVNVPAGIWTALYRSNALELYKNGIMVLPSITVEMIGAASVKAVVTKEYLESSQAKSLQRIVTSSFSISNADNKYVIIIDNGAAAITITVPAGLMSKLNVGFVQKGTGEVLFVESGTTVKFPATTGLKIKGQNWNAYLMQAADATGNSTNEYFLLGNTKA